MRWMFAGVGALAVALGAALWMGSRLDAAPEPKPAPASIHPAALYATTFRDASGATQPLGRFQGRILVLNFWATWCPPCRDEMPAFDRLQRKWAERGVQFVGLSDEDPAKVAEFGRSMLIDYPLWTGGEEVDKLGKRLGNRLNGLPFTVIVDRDGRVLEARLGPYREAELEERLSAYSANAR
jgi:thiol-disulfide isomerase/thioredoxin